jgi:PAS domain S-box-containing protein
MDKVDQTFSFIEDHLEYQRFHQAGIINVLAIDEDLRIVYVNEAEKEFSGYKNEEQLNRPISDFYHEDGPTPSLIEHLKSGLPLQSAEATGVTKNKLFKCVLISSMIFVDKHHVKLTYLFIRDITIYKKKEDLLAYLNKATEEMAKARDTKTALDKISKLIVPKFANWFTIEQIKDGELDLLVLAHEDPEQIKWALEYRKAYPVDLQNDATGSAEVVRTGKPSFVPVITKEMVYAGVTDPVKLESVLRMNLQSVITVAMFNKNTVTGLISFITTEEGKYYDETDLRFAQNFANHISLALDNARLNDEAAAEIEYRKQIEEKLKITQQQLKSALSSGLVGTWTRDLEKNILYADESLSKMFGIPYSPEGSDPQIFQNRINADVKGATDRKRNESIIKGGVYETEYQVNTGEEDKYFFVRGRTELNDQGKPSVFSGVVVDITERKKAESALKESEERYSAAFANASVGITLTTLEAKILKTNAAFIAITGYTEAELIHMHDFREITHPDDLQGNYKLYDKLLTHDIPNFVIEKRYINKNGHIVWVRNSASLVKDADGQASSIIIITEDITERKEAQAAVKNSEELFKLVAETMPQKVFTTNAHGSIMYLNPQWVQFTGYTMDEIHKLTLTHFIHPEDVEKNLEMWHQALQTGESFLYEHRFLNKDGEYLWHLTRALPLRDDDGNILQWIGTITDINDQKLKEEKKDEFISIASHELRTPLTTVKAFFQLAKKTLNSGDKAYGFIDKAGRQLDRLERLIADLLNVSKINAGKMVYNMDEFTFDDMLRETVESVQHTTTTHQIIVEHTADVKYKGDKLRIEEVLNNFLTNAIKYSPGADKVIVRSELDGTNLIVSVQDFGIGIAAENLTDIFDRFYRVDNTSMRYQGLGLGLFIAAEIIKRHNGSFWIESELGKGSTFFFLLPLNGKQEFFEIDTDYSTFYKGNFVDIIYNADNECIEIDWIGYQNLESVKKGCFIVLDMFKKHNCRKILNDNTHVLGSWSEAVDWGSEVWFPAMQKAGLKYFAWIYSPSTFSRLSAHKSIDVLIGEITAQFFMDKNEAIEWISDK